MKERATPHALARADGRAIDELRPASFERDFTVFAPGSVLVSMGRTRVLCTASVEERVPPWMRGSGKGWVTAEYSLLPGSTGERVTREAAKGKQSGRTQEIQRLIGRSLRSVCDMVALGEMQVTVDCDVLQADGGTRTASICGAYVALHDALTRLVQKGTVRTNPLTEAVAAVSVGVVDGVCMLDLPYEEDSRAEVDMNVVMTSSGRFIEVQGTAEGMPFTKGELDEMLSLAEHGIAQLLELQTEVLAEPPTPPMTGRAADWSWPPPTRTRRPRSSTMLGAVPGLVLDARARRRSPTSSRTGTRWSDNARLKARALVEATGTAGRGRRHRARGRGVGRGARVSTRPATPASTPPTPRTWPKLLEELEPRRGANARSDERRPSGPWPWWPIRTVASSGPTGTVAGRIATGAGR